MKNKIELFPTIASNDVAIQFTDSILLEKAVIASVPTDYFAIIYIDEKPSARLDVCDKTVLYKYVGKEFLGKHIRLAYIKKIDLPLMNWGFGDIHIRNEKYDQTYRTGANGKYLLTINDAQKVVKAFGTEENISKDLIESKTKILIQSVGTPLLNQYINSNCLSAFDLNSKSEEFRDLLEKCINDKNTFEALGFKLKSLSIRNIHVNEEDMEIIRKNTSKTSTNDVEKPEMFEKFKEELLELINNDNDGKMKDELQSLREEVARIAENQETDTVLDEIDNLRTEMVEALKTKGSTEQDDNSQFIMDEIGKIKDEISSLRNEDSSAYIENSKQMLDDLEKRFEDKIDESFSIFKGMVENSIEEKIQGLLPLYPTAEKDWLKELKITTDLLLSKAETDDDYAAVAGLMFSNVESNLITKFNVNHKGKDFYMGEDEYKEFAKIQIGKESIFKNYSPRTLYYPDMEGKYVEMPLEVRFIKAGLKPGKASELAKDWTVLNKLRHRSEENKEKLDKILTDRNMSKKDYLKSLLQKLRAYGLYTRD